MSRGMWRAAPPAGVWIFVAAAAVASAFFIDFCDLVYGCGCRSLWAGGGAHCNIHKTQPPHCPWCSIGLGGWGGMYVLILLSQGAAVNRSRGFFWPWRLAFALLAFPLTGGVLAVVAGLATGYWN